MDHHESTGSISLFFCGADERKVLMAVRAITKSHFLASQRLLA